MICCPYRRHFKLDFDGVKSKDSLVSEIQSNYMPDVAQHVAGIFQHVDGVA